jgi:cyclase
MQRRTFIRNTAISAAGLGLLNNKLFASILPDPAWKIKMLTDKIGVFTEKGGTILFLLTKKGTVVVDSQFTDTAVHLIDELKKKSEKPFRFLINTHHHGDHTSGNISFKGMVKNVIAHENSFTNQKTAAINSKTEARQLYPDWTFGDEGWHKKVGEEEIQAYYFGPGHTNGDSIIHFETSNIAHMGDLVFNRRYPFIDKTAGASIKNWIKILHKTDYTFDGNTQFVFGHSGTGYEITGNKADINAFKDYLEKLLEFGKNEIIRSGKSKEDFLKAKSIPGVTEWKGDGIERSLSAVWEELVNGS